jgi:3-hydroxyethyl bacteriochlorophyllide a dehydrogenase
MQTRAVVIPQPSQVELQSVTLRPLAADEVLIETAYTSISAGTERMLLAGQMPHPMLQLPVVPGYETVGRVVETGAEVADDLQGRWVYVGGAQCYEGINAAWGGQSAQIITAAQRVVPLDGVEPRKGVLLALAATALHGIDVVNPAADSRMLVIGQGPVGQLAARIAQERGAWVAASDINATRLSHAAGDVVINAEETPLADAVREPVNTIIEASGSMTALADALPLLANGGTILLLGYYRTLDLPYMPLFLKEARLLTAREWGAGDLLRCRDMIAEGRLEVSTMLTHELPISEVARAYDVAMNDPECLKVVLDWSEHAPVT